MSFTNCLANKALEHKLKGKSEAHEAMLDDGRRRFVWK